MLKYVATFAKKNFRELGKKNCRGVSCWNPGGLSNGQSLHEPLDRQPYHISRRPRLRKGERAREEDKSLPPPATTTTTAAATTTTTATTATTTSTSTAAAGTGGPAATSSSSMADQQKSNNTAARTARTAI